MKLVSLAEWEKLGPRSKGYVLYMQAEHPSSELKGKGNPYDKGTAQHTQFQAGEQAAVLDAQDSDD